MWNLVVVSAAGDTSSLLNRLYGNRSLAVVTKPGKWTELLEGSRALPLVTPVDKNIHVHFMCIIIHISYVFAFVERPCAVYQVRAIVRFAV